MRAIEVLREANRQQDPVLPETAPTGFAGQRWAPYVLPGGKIDRRHYELCVLSELRDRLRTGEVWVTGSRQEARTNPVPLDLVPPENLAWFRVRGLVPAGLPGSEQYQLALRESAPESGAFILFSLRGRSLNKSRGKSPRKRGR